MDLIGTLFGSLSATYSQPKVDCSATMQNLDLLNRGMNIGETWYHGALVWHPGIGLTYSVQSGPFLTRREADEMTVRQALQLGYTAPKWWEFWRWGERPLPRPTKESDE